MEAFSISLFDMVTEWVGTECEMMSESRFVTGNKHSLFDSGDRMIKHSQYDRVNKHSLDDRVSKHSLYGTMTA